jgi:hypothetical protein
MKSYWIFFRLCLHRVGGCYRAAESQEWPSDVGECSLVFDASRPKPVVEPFLVLSIESFRFGIRVLLAAVCLVSNQGPEQQQQED